MEAFSKMKTPAFVLDLSTIRQQLQALSAQDKETTEADICTRAFYTQETEQPLVWIRQMGTPASVDTLLYWLHRVGEEGLSEKGFGVEEIESDFKRMRSLDFDDQENTASQVAARLEYRLTKACLRYAYGQRFGFVNPSSTFGNNFDVAIDLPTKAFADEVLKKVRIDSLPNLLREIQPHDKFYIQLKNMLTKTDSDQQRQRIVCNMERCRWRLHQPIKENEKRIVVNVPAFQLYAFCPDSVMTMKVVCGAVATHTPLLSSYIEKMEVNPQWVIPMSIIRKDVAGRAGDSSYFVRRRYQIYDASTGKTVSPSSLSSQMLASGRYRVAQSGGAGNALGRIVFRFKNKFAVYLHDTSTPSAFQLTNRALSHGCVRLSRPFDLAKFVLNTSDEWLLDRIRIAMGKPAETEQGQQYVKSHSAEQVKRVISNVPLDTPVPLYIIYYTIWPDENGTLQTWPDIYGYDQTIWRKLQPFMS